MLHCKPPSSDRTEPSVCSMKSHADGSFYSVRKVVFLMLTAYPTIDAIATGANIKSKGLKVTDVQAIFGFHTPQAIFKWMRGDALPSIDNIVILAHILDVTVDKIIITNIP